ncbi:hypothetical protein B566_EDAN015186 [Ephemera danica]|nr:hypothetical protein B566_EDAN015186 [Ephemera danica]
MVAIMPSTSFLVPSSMTGSGSSSQSRCNATSSSSSSSLSSLGSRGTRADPCGEANDYGFIEYRRSATMDNTYNRQPKIELSPSRRTANKYLHSNHDDYANPIRNVIRKSASLLSANWWANRILQHNKSQNNMYYNQSVKSRQLEPSMTRRWRSVGTLLRSGHTDEQDVSEACTSSERHVPSHVAPRQQQGVAQQQQQYRPRASTLVQQNRRNVEESVGHRRTMSLLNNNNNIENTRKPQEFYLLDDFLRHPTPPREQPLQQPHRDEISSQRLQQHKPVYHTSLLNSSSRVLHKPTDYKSSSASQRSYSMDTSKYRYPQSVRHITTDQRATNNYRSQLLESRRNAVRPTPLSSSLHPALGHSPEPPPVPPPPPSDLLSDLYRRSISDRSCSCRSCDVRLIHDSYATLLSHSLVASSTNPPAIHQKEAPTGLELSTSTRQHHQQQQPSSKLGPGSRLSHVSAKSATLCNGDLQSKHRISRDLAVPPPPPPAAFKQQQQHHQTGVTSVKGSNNNQHHKLDNQQLSPNNNNVHHNNNKCGGGSPCSESSSPRKPAADSKGVTSVRDGITYPVSSAEALRLFGSRLTQYERTEIAEYPQVWYLGLDACKIHCEEGGPQNGGYDDDNGSYHKVLHDHVAYRYEILEVIGRGSFGQVIRALDHKTNTHVAIKIIRNKKRFHHQALVEVRILDHLRKKDRDGSHNIIHMLEYFYFRNHLCISFELMSLNLYELIKKNNYQGFSLNLIQRFTRSLIQCLRLLHRENIIHCDLKPENVLLKQRGSTGIKVIDFGSSCYSHHRVFTYIQSRFYRSPEVILGLPYGTPIDMWSLGCILAELYTGYPLFPGENEVEQLACIMEVLGMPPKSVVAAASRRRLFFDSKGNPRCITNSKGRKRKPGTKELATATRCNDRLFVDFISQCLEWDATKRMTPDEALKHPWLNQTSSTFELTRCSSQETPTSTHKSASAAALASTRSDSDLPGSSSILPPPPPPPLPNDAYSLYRVYKGTRKPSIHCSKERQSSADAIDRRSQNRTGSMQRESSLPEKSSLDDSGTFLPPIL